MAWIEPHGRGYRVRWRDDGILRTQPCETKTQALVFKAQLESGEALAPVVGGRRVTVTEWAELWRDTRPHLKASSASTDRGRLDNHIIGRDIGRKPLAKVTPMVVRGWVTELLEDLAPKTVRNCHGLLYTLMQAAVDERLIATNPCKGTPLPQVIPTEMHFLTIGQLDTLIATIDAWARPLVIFLAGTGMRWGEAVGLRRRNVNLLEGYATVVESLHEVDGKLSWGTPKSRSSRRIVSLPATVVDALIPLSLGDADVPIFTTPRGMLIRRNNFSRRTWKTAIAKANKEQPVLPTDLRVHDLRHTHAAQLIAANQPLTAISRRLGHASISVTSDVYGHLLPEVDEQLVAALDKAFAGLTAPKSAPSEPDDVSTEPVAVDVSAGQEPDSWGE